jgi:hypothetical protein
LRQTPTRRRWDGIEHLFEDEVSFNDEHPDIVSNEARPQLVGVLQATGVSPTLIVGGQDAAEP